MIHITIYNYIYTYIYYSVAILAQAISRACQTIPFLANCFLDAMGRPESAKSGKSRALRAGSVKSRKSAGSVKSRKKPPTTICKPTKKKLAITKKAREEDDGGEGGGKVLIKPHQVGKVCGECRIKLKKKDYLYRSTLSHYKCGNRKRSLDRKAKKTRRRFRNL